MHKSEHIKRNSKPHFIGENGVHGAQSPHPKTTQTTNKQPTMNNVILNVTPHFLKNDRSSGSNSSIFNTNTILKSSYPSNLSSDK